jgi:uncharacterized protein YacL
MFINLIRVLFIMIMASVGARLAELGYLPVIGAVGGAVSGVVLAAVVIFFEKFLKGTSLKELGIAAAGLVIGLVAANLVSIPFYLIGVEEMRSRVVVPIAINLIFAYIGVIMSLERKAGFTLLPFLRGGGGEGTLKLLDTNVIIDGRIYDLAKTGLLGTNLIIPRFVLNELHAIADCPDSLKRKRGRRGIEFLNKMQKDPHLNVTVHDTDFVEVEGVDSKLVKLAKMMGADILTNDYNLNKIAELQDVRVLNINEFANALKPVMIPGEAMSVKVVKEGKEKTQGVAYLEDGTMIVVENGRRSVGLTVDIVVTSVLQTATGKMIFAKLAGSP